MDPWALAHPWLREAAGAARPPPLVDAAVDVECVRVDPATAGPRRALLATRFVVWPYAPGGAAPGLCYVFVCPEDAGAGAALKADGWRSPGAVRAAGWLVHPLRWCEWAWPEEDAAPAGLECRSMCCRDTPLVRRVITDVAAPEAELRARLGAMHPTDYRSFLLKALDYLAM